MTEKEIHDGILHVDEPNKHCLWFERMFTDLQEATLCDHKRNFIDIDNGKLDHEAKKLMDELKTKKLADLLHVYNHDIYKLQWCYECKNTEHQSCCGLNPNAEEHATYLKKICNDFDSQVSQMIQDGIKERYFRDI